MPNFYFDEDLAQHRLIEALRSHAVDVATFLDAEMSARDDQSQLIFATEHSRVLVSANVRDFSALHQAWQRQGRSHAGILLIPQQRFSTGEIVRRMVRLTSSKFDMTNGLYFLSNF